VFRVRVIFPDPYPHAEAADPDPHSEAADQDPGPYPFPPNEKLNFTLFHKIFVEGGKSGKYPARNSSTCAL
jgi:hypothetical protein